VSRERLLLQLWALVVFGLAVRAFASALVRDGAVPPLAVKPLVFDINRASVVELQLLPGLGRTRAEAIVLERIRHGGFRDLGDLQRVDGIGPLTIAALAPYLCSGDTSQDSERDH
jgi:competence protein ComEA